MQILAWINVQMSKEVESDVYIQRLRSAATDSSLYLVILTRIKVLHLSLHLHRSSFSTSGLSESSLYNTQQL